MYENYNNQTFITHAHSRWSLTSSLKISKPIIWVKCAENTPATQSDPTEPDIWTRSGRKAIYSDTIVPDSEESRFEFLLHCEDLMG